jgi:hypothetical protein
VARERGGIVVVDNHPARLDDIEDLPFVAGCRDKNRPDPGECCSAVDRETKIAAPPSGESDAHAVSGEPGFPDKRPHQRPFRVV